MTKELLFDELLEIRENLKNSIIPSEQSWNLLNEIEKKINLDRGDRQKRELPLIEKIFASFNLHNFADSTALIKKSSPVVEVIHHCGSNILLAETKTYLEDDHSFYKTIDSLIIASTKYNLFFKEFSVKDESYAVLTWTSSSSFDIHKLDSFCDVISAFIKHSAVTHSFFYDLMEKIDSDFHNTLALFSKSSPSIILVKFDFIFENSINTFIGISKYISSFLRENTGDNSFVIPLSFSSYLIIAPQEDESLLIKNFISSKKLSFNYKNILLPYMALKIDSNSSLSIYDIFEDLCNLMRLS